MADVFISYHVASAAGIVRQINAELRRRGIYCWYSETGVLVGEDFARAIPTEIEACRVFLLVLDEGANRSQYVENELGLAFRRKSRGEAIDIIPFQVEKSSLSGWMDYYLLHIQRIDGTVPPIYDRVREVVDQIEKVVGWGNWQELKRLHVELDKAQAEIDRIEEIVGRGDWQELKRLRAELDKAQTKVERLQKKLRLLKAKIGQEDVSRKALSRKRDFFISYTTADKTKAEWIAETLEKRGYTVYFQAWHSPPGQSFIEWMNKGISNSENFIAVWSAAYDRSGYCKSERDAAYSEQVVNNIKMFLPVRIEDVDLPPLFKTLVRVDLFDVDEAEAERRLIRAIERGQRGR